MAELMAGAPELLPARLEQLPALPLGTRIKVNAWTDTVEMMRSKPVALVSAREKMSFLVTPLFPASDAGRRAVTARSDGIS